MKNPFTHCPHCGTKNLNDQFEKAVKCNDCDIEYYHNTATAVAAILEFEDKIIITTRGHQPEKGKYDLPGGFVDYDESAEQALKREIKEELTLDLDLYDFTYFTSQPNRYTYKDIDYAVVDIYFTAKVHSTDNIVPQDDVCDYKLIKPCELKFDNFAFPSSIKALTLYKELKG